ncbi:nucleotidyltransferase domain-containing protein [Flavobacterium capsici]|uniref:Nucleotidyltransferase domain-containing protein n=1 Tax=Flavobacterium capsici TaxID=3075618 RepID=A0AA96J5T1_9FLAO|nr:MULTISPECIES: nucleotidyltransferase domain-containing protein [unclassified Flavobacterium]WNM19366.1 nucleotidyltransferase domain-containing protein [Flavobacterium sp. PMR2A8]WNM20755.1 nucleotidyltransferase domain-containing protein [Flavobacterium sp. PMTSA4]
MDSLKTILYFSIFRYPLKLEEIHSYNNHTDIDETFNELQYLINEKIVTKIDDFYVYGTDLDSVTKRLKGNLQAKKALIKAKERAKFISKFPYVQSVGVSGSLSKGYFDNDSDIDFFVITKPEKLWICRTLLMLYKKIFLLNSRKYFCINYFVSSCSLEIEEQNRFTATELKTLIPLQGKDVFKQFYNENKWIYDYFSKFTPEINSVEETQKPFFSKTIEFIFDNKIGNKVDNAFKIITLKKWQSKFSYMNQTDFKIALKSTKNISKHHPSNFQKKVIFSLNEKLEEVRQKFNIEIIKEYV